jgi:hypothetical protein
MSVGVASKLDRRWSLYGMLSTITSALIPFFALIMIGFLGTQVVLTRLCKVVLTQLCNSIFGRTKWKIILTLSKTKKAFIMRWWIEVEFNSPWAFLQSQNMFYRPESKKHPSKLQEFHWHEKSSLVRNKLCSKDFRLIWNILYGYCNWKIQDCQIQFWNVNCLSYLQTFA